MNSINDDLLAKLKRRNIFSEYLTKSFCMDFEEYDVYNAGGSYKDYIEPYSYTMSRFVKNGDRRTIGIPDASAYVSIINFLKNNPMILSDIVEISTSNKYSFSRIVDSNSVIVDDDGKYENNDIILSVHDGDEALEEEKKRSVFIDNMLSKMRITMGACGILHIDISEFYGSIYTHIIPAIPLGIDGALEAYDNGGDDDNYKLYNNLDVMIRGLNCKRTNGLLIGPYLSKVIAETILAKIDEELTNKGLVFTRYADDYEFAIYEKNDMENVKAIVGSVFDRYFFRINNEKSFYEEYPFYVFSNFEQVIGENVKENVEIVEMLNEFLELEMRGEKGAIRYLLKAYQDKYKVKDVDIYYGYLINILCNDEKSLALVCDILIREYEKKNIVFSELVKDALNKKLSREINNKHEWEVIWIVYLFKYTDCAISSELFDKLWDSEFELLKVLMIHEFSIEETKLRDCFEKSNAWILLYELAVYLNDFDLFVDKMGIKNSKGFYKNLFDNKYSFYKKRRTITSSQEKE